jgi:hypothetical protein
VPVRWKEFLDVHEIEARRLAILVLLNGHCAPPVTNHSYATLEIIPRLF